VGKTGSQIKCISPQSAFCPPSPEMKPWIYIHFIFIISGLFDYCVCIYKLYE
jgi:hypothetical protein